MVVEEIEDVLLLHDTWLQVRSLHCQTFPPFNIKNTITSIDLLSFMLLPMPLLDDLHFADDLAPH